VVVSTIGDVKSSKDKMTVKFGSQKNLIFKLPYTLDISARTNIFSLGGTVLISLKNRDDTRGYFMHNHLRTMALKIFPQ
jgi:hypothetical protein